MADMIKRKDFQENEVVDLTEEIKQTSPTDTPLTTLLMSRGQVVPAKDITVTWREKELNSERGTLKLEALRQERLSLLAEKHSLMCVRSSKR